MLGLGPPPLRLLAAPFGRLAALRVGLAPGPPVGPSAPLGPVSAAGWLGPPPLPLGRSGGRCGLRRAACAPCGGLGRSPRWPPLRRGRVRGRGGSARPVPRPPAWGALALPSAGLRAPLRGWGALAALRAGPGPSCAARAPPRPAPSGGPAVALGRRRCVPPGGGCGGGCAAPFVPPPPPSVGIIRPDGPPSRAYASGQMATLDSDPLARFNVTKGRGWRVRAERKSSLHLSYICAIIRLARETFPRWRSIHCQRGEALFFAPTPSRPPPQWGRGRRKGAGFPGESPQRQKRGRC